jgi:hypothetical protein
MEPLYKHWYTLPEDEPHEKVKTHRSYSVVIVKTLLSYSAFAEVLLNCNSLCMDVNTIENIMSEINEHCSCLIMSLSSLQLNKQAVWGCCWLDMKGVFNGLASGISLLVAHKWQWYFLDTNITLQQWSTNCVDQNLLWEADSDLP